MDKLLDFKTASLSVDFSCPCLLVTWHGKVDFEEYKTVLTKATEILEIHKIPHVIINRLALTELNTECRVWMKNDFLKKLVRPAIPKLTKVATIESRSAIQVYAKTISKTVSLVYPNLTFRSFTSESDAHQWINPNAAPNLPEPVLVHSSDNPALMTSQNNDVPNPTDSFQLEQRRNRLIESLYQLFFANR